MATRRTVEEGKRRMGTPAFFGLVTLTCVVAVLGAVMIGKSDSGQIDVSATIQNSNQANIENGDTSNNIGTVADALRDMPNGGLVAQEGQPTPLPPVIEASTTVDGTGATSTATSTDAEGENTSEDETQNGGQ